MTTRTTLTAIAALALAAAATAPARAAVLTSGNADFETFDTNGTNNVFRVDPRDEDDDNVFVANFYLGGAGLSASNGGVVPISGVGAVTTVQPSANAVTYTAANATLAATQQYVLTGGPTGSGLASVQQLFTLQNRSTATRSLSLYFAADYDVDFDQSTDPNDVTTVLSPSAILTADPVTGASLLTQAVAPTAYKVYPGAFDEYFTFFYPLNGAPVLDDTPAVGGSTTDNGDDLDAGFAFGWDVSLAPGQSLSYAVTTTHAVPEPTSAALAGAAGASGLLRRGRRRRRPA